MNEVVKKTKSKYKIPNCFVGEVTSDQEVLTIPTGDSKDSSYNFCSVSKLVTSILIIKLIASNEVSLDDTIKKELSDFPDERVTVEDCLRHVSGLIDKEENFLPNKELNREHLITDVTLDNYGEFLYSDHGYMILQFFLEEKFKQDFSTLITKMIFEPLGLKSFKYLESLSDINSNTFVKGYNQENHELKDSYSIYPYAAACGLWGSGTDLLTFIQEVVNGLHGKSSLAIPKNVYSLLLTSKYEEWLGLGCFLDDTPSGLELSSLGWGQGYQSLVSLMPDKSKALVILTNKDSGVHQLKGFCGAVYREWVTTFI